MERYKHTPVMEGTASFDVEIDKPLDEGETQRIFNTLINNNAVYKEFTFTMEDNYYDIFDVIVELEKTGDVEVEDVEMAECYEEDSQFVRVDEEAKVAYFEDAQDYDE